VGHDTAYRVLAGDADVDVVRDEPLARHTTYRIGGPARLMATAHTVGGLRRTLEALDAACVDWVVLGGGSNVLVSDEGYDACVIRLGRGFRDLRATGVTDAGDAAGAVVADEDARATSLTAGAGASLSKLVMEACHRGLSGLEACVGVPGSVGGAIRMDAGSRTEWIGQHVARVVVMRPGVGLVCLQGSDISWGYRATSLEQGDIVLEVTLELEPSSQEEISADMERRIARRRASQPLGLPSCGSVFRNPEGRSSAELVEGCGLKGYAVGGARVSERHANFVVNEGGATASDVVAVMGKMHGDVLGRYDIDLTPEVRFLGF